MDFYKIGNYKFFLANPTPRCGKKEWLKASSGSAAIILMSVLGGLKSVKSVLMHFILQKAGVNFADFAFGAGHGNFHAGF